ncbi:glucose-6-phosphate 1-dehydrogenase, cytoplasmic isoform-like [Panicum virgatum]|uniref:Glucose-6-phosphate 1-dehydrogenase n=1 Tax=Panicum virgatum TaxID=38727 RepID=A0A8T0QJF8_PANVG|nr:glucose-6-phosphate 1-dehydrogenase, cytoplasmic isoform-like [Panicum virgatum]XP_039773290.1 glucose-6-phosphate 1-dehydrogenase, cytoplasmic isoform-like [Panicum virgatum]XP_039773291.1 glucose-6-phosphate 1-dehydrogenase, cytoplasmic isoform-like [Panicum virgatum]XP_039773292.1 glucose-6-phosphate 1-dehydrogenase, cytoplasmic isoform-like [Panicum virgatum]XP_039773293.1 glucose-6-phosphate 1-dehydrogenase, cytoplasmic isoform-like [Panicum virgatum]XP_039773294.1 glucose-6-phosphate 
MSGGSGGSSPPSRRTSFNSLSRDLDLPSEQGCLSIVVLGASGDLAKKKTFPALYHLFDQGFIQSGEVHIFGYARSNLSDDGLRERIRGYLKGAPEEDLSEFLQLIKYVSGSYDNGEGFEKLNKAISEYEASSKSESYRRLFYLALPPSVYPSVCKMIRTYCMNPSSHPGWTRVIVEKPFGKDLDSAEELSAQLGELFEEHQLYRIDHYLGKELVQNLLVLRFANRLFMPLWNRDNIDNIQIVFREDFGTEGRGGYFDQYGIIRDIIQNHLLQVFCLVAMEKPVSLKPEHIRDEKVKVLQSVNPINPEEVVLGQYDGYKDDPTVPDDSNTPTFASVVLRVHNERWEGVPFILKAGKALNSRKAEVRVQFKDVPGDIFKCKKQGRNEFVIRLQPSEAMYVKLTVKKPGLEMATEQSELDLSYGMRYQNVKIPEAYERLILDTIRGDQQHFVRRDELKAAWQIFTPLLHDIDDGKLMAVPYQPGSRGPKEADELSAKVGYVQTHGYIWIPPTLA